MASLRDSADALLLTRLDADMRCNHEWMAKSRAESMGGRYPCVDSVLSIARKHQSPENGKLLPNDRIFQTTGNSRREIPRAPWSQSPDNDLGCILLSVIKTLLMKGAAPHELPQNHGFVFPPISR